MKAISAGWSLSTTSHAARSKTFKEIPVRQGAQMALGYILGGTDFTFANVISNGEYPVFIDLEMLFQTPLLPDSLTGVTARAWYASQASVMETGLLPEPISLAGDDHAIDLSGLGNREGQLTPFHMPLWRGDGTDRMRLVHARVPMEGGTSLPAYEGRRVEAGIYVDQLIDGFGRMYDFLQKRKAELMADHGPLGVFFGKPVRVTFRSSAWYGQLLAASYHPRQPDRRAHLRGIFAQSHAIGVFKCFLAFANRGCGSREPYNG